MNPRNKIHLLCLLLFAAFGAPSANAVPSVTLIGSERIVFVTPTGANNIIPYPCGNIPAIAIGPNYRVYSAPYFDGPIAPISYGSNTLRFNVSSGYKNYRITSTLTGSGANADFTVPAVLDCYPVYTASLSVPNDTFAWAEWLYGTFRDVPSGNVYSVIYNEYYGGGYYPGPPADGYGVYVALGLGISTDNGATFSKIQPAPNHVMVRSPYLRQPVAASYGYGWFGGLFKSPLDQMYYVGAGGAETGTTALVRTNNLNDPTSWRAWDGSGFNVPTIPLSQPYHGIGINPLYLGYSDYFAKYIAVTTGSSDHYASGNNLVVYNLSDDLVNWGVPRRIMYNPACGPTHVCDVSGQPPSISSYPSIMDPVYLIQSGDSTKASNGMTGPHPYVTYIKNVNTGGTHQQFAAQQVSFDNVVVNRMDNFSMRAIVGRGNAALVMGFITQGSESKQFVFRGMGPSLALPPDFGYPKIANPRISLYDVNGSLIASNLGWTTLSLDDQNFLISKGLQPGSTSESAIVWTLAPGSYTIKMDNGTGVGVIEGYDLSSTAESKIVQVSIRGYSQPGNGAVTMGFIFRGGQTGVIRGTGVSTLAPVGFSPVIPDPYISVYDGAGSLIAANDNWQDDPNHGLIQNYGLAPRNALESATMVSTQKGIYTAQLQGTGYGLLELYNVNPN